jgi:hypothetical protein
VHAILDKLDGEAAEWFWIPTTVDDKGDALVLDYALEPTESLPFAAALPRFTQASAVYLPELVVMARYLAGCAHVLERAEMPAAIAPAYLRYAPEREGAFRLMVVPLVDVTLTDWAKAAPEAWSWTPPAMLLGKPASQAYAIGAALTHALTGDVVAPHVPASVRFSRALRGWIGRPVKLAAAVAAALPASFTDEAAALTALVAALLEPSPPPDWRDRLRELGEKLAPRRVAVRWEYEGKLDIARGIVERLAATTPKQHVPWDVVARVRGESEDIDGALQAAIDALGTDSDAVRELAAVSRRIVHGLPPDRHRPMLERAVAAVDRMGPRLGDLGRLHFAHLEARYLERYAQATARLAQPASGPWDNVLRDTLLARIHAARAEWAHVAKLCKQARAATREMPNAGGALGAYVIAYLDYLDGVAHCGAVRVYGDPGYLADAFDRLVASLDASRALCEAGDPLVDSTVDWLHGVAELAQTLAVPSAAAIRAGIVAYLGAAGLTRRISEPYRRETPPIVWYDAQRLLALSGVP